MATSMNRRNWLKTSSMLTGGLAFLPATWNKLEAAPVKPAGNMLSEAEFLADVPPAIKARLSANENPFGPSDSAKKAISKHYHPAINTASWKIGHWVKRYLPNMESIKK